MKYTDGKVEDIKIAYIGGGSRNWAWGLMSDLVSADDISGDVYLYDIDFEAAKDNEKIGTMYNSAEGAKSVWNYHAVKTIDEALTGANFVIISILPGTFDEMESDVHTPEKYGIYQSVGDTTGPGGIVRAMRTVPMYEFFAESIKKFCPDAWVINYTNPMTLCTRTLYRVFPEIKAFGCCHEVFGTQKFLAEVLDLELGIKDVQREEIKVNPVAVNHFTWLTEAKYKDIDVYPIYAEFCKKHVEKGYLRDGWEDGGWLNKFFENAEKVKMDLFTRYGIIAAAGDRHLAEFCEGDWYMGSLERVNEMCFGLTPVSWRKNVHRQGCLDRNAKLLSGEEEVKINLTGEEGVAQIRALLGLHELITNVNIPNQGQIPNLPLGAVVETNAIFRTNSLQPVFAGPIPQQIYPLVSRVCGAQEELCDATGARDVERIFMVFANDPLVTCGLPKARELFREMVMNTKEYLTSYDLSSLE